MSSPFAKTTRALAADSPRAALLAWGLAGVVLAAWCAWFSIGRVTLYEVSRQARLEVSQAPHALASPLAGALSRSTLVIGRSVQAGELLVELDSSGPQLRWQEERSRQAALPPRLASLQQEIAALQAALAADQQAAAAAADAARARVQEATAGLQFAREHGRRLRGETASGSVAEVDAQRAEAEAGKAGAARDALAADQRRAALDAQARQQQGQAQIESLRRASAVLTGELATSQASMARLAQEIERHRLRAPVDGQLGEVLALRPGAFVTEGQRLATIVPRGGLLIVADFDPASALGRLQPGQPARLRLDGFPWAQYGSVGATVLRVGGEIRDQRLRVELRLDADAAGNRLLRHGLAGQVEVAVEQASPAQLLLRLMGQWIGGSAAPAPLPAPASGG